MNTKILSPILFFVSLVMGYSQIQITSATSYTYSQDFNSLPKSGNHTWTQNGTLAEWYGYGHNGGEKTYIVATNGTLSNVISANGSSINASLSIGNGTESDRSLGLYAGTISGNQYYLISFQNSSGNLIQDMSIEFTGLKTEADAAVKPLELYYRTSATPFTINGTLATGAGWTQVSGISYQPGSGVDSGTAISGSLSNLGIANGNYLLFRFKLDYTGSGNVPIGIDDLSIKTIPEPVTVSLLMVGLLMCCRRPGRLRQTDGADS